MRFVISRIECFSLFLRQITIQVACCKNSAGKIATNGQKRNFHGTFGLKLSQRLANFRQMLMHKRFVNRNVIVAPTKMRCCRRSLSRSRRACNGVCVHFATYQSGFCQRQQSQLYGGGKAPGLAINCADFIASRFSSGSP